MSSPDSMQRQHNAAQGKRVHTPPPPAVSSSLELIFSGNVAAKLFELVLRQWIAFANWTWDLRSSLNQVVIRSSYPTVGLQLSILTSSVIAIPIVESCLDDTVQSTVFKMPSSFDVICRSSLRPSELVSQFQFPIISVTPTSIVESKSRYVLGCAPRDRPLKFFLYPLSYL